MHRGQVVGPLIVDHRGGEERSDLVAAVDVSEASGLTAPGKKIAWLFR